MSEEITGRPAVLLVDDEPAVLSGLRRTLGRTFAITTEDNPLNALKTLRLHGPFVAVVSDLRMPQIDGVELLRRCGEIDPDAKRIMLTGNADLESSTRAINQGHVWHLLSKPTSAEELKRVLTEATEVHRREASQRAMLDQTLQGAIDAMTDLIEHVDPDRFRRARRLADTARELGMHFGVSTRWEVEVAALLSELGTLGAATDPAAMEDDDLSPGRQRAARALRRIPRMTEVADIVEHQDAHFDRDEAPTGGDLPLGARILHLAMSLEPLESQGLSRSEALQALEGEAAHFDPDLWQAVTDHAGRVGTRVVGVHGNGLTPGMVLAVNVIDDEGHLLASRGMALTDRTAERLRQVAEDRGQQPLYVFVEE